MKVTLNYTDGTTSSSSFTVYDWWDNNSAATKIYQRMDSSKNMGATDGSNAGAPYFTQCKMSVDSSKLIKNISISAAGTSRGMILNVLGLTGETADLAAPTVNINSSSVKQTSFDCSWTKVSGANGYRVDVSTSPDFQSFVPGYNNKDVGNVTSLTVTGLNVNTKYYVRVRAYNPGQSASSNVASTTTLYYPSFTTKVNLTLDGQAYTSRKVTLVQNGAVRYRLTEGANGAYSASVKQVGNITYNVYVDGADTGETIILLGNVEKTVNYYTATANVNLDDSGYTGRNVTLVQNGAVMEKMTASADGVYKVPVVAREDNTYQVYVDGSDTSSAVTLAGAESDAVANIGNGGSGAGGGSGYNTGLQGYGPTTSSSYSTSGKYPTGVAHATGAGGAVSSNSGYGYVYAASTATVSSITNTSSSYGRGASKSTASSNTAVNYTVTLGSSASSDTVSFDIGNTSETKRVTIGVIPETISFDPGNYYFEGFYTGQNGTGEKVFNADGNPNTDNSNYFDSTGAWIYNGDLTVYAYLIPKERTITFINGEGATTTDDMIVNENALVKSVSPLPTKDGYRFDGYYTFENGEGTKLFDTKGNPVKGTDYIDADGNWIYKGNVTLYANWAFTPEGDAVHSEIVYGIIKTDIPAEYFYGNVNILSDDSPANADSVTLVSGETELSLSPSSTGTYDYTALQSGTYEVYVNGENTGKTLTIDSTDSANPNEVEVNLYSVEVAVKKNGAPLSNADIAIKSGSKTRMLPESSTQSGTYSLRSLASSTDYVVYLDGEETSETVMFASTGNTAEIELFETTVRTLINDALTDSMGNITLVNGDNFINTVMTSTGIFKAETDEGVTYDVYLNGKDTGIDVASGTSADVVAKSTFVTFTKDGEAFDSDRTVEITNGTEKFELAPYNSSNNTYTVNLLSNDSTVYNVLVDGKDTGYTVTANTTTTVNYLTTTVKVTKDGVAYDAYRTVTIKNDTETIKPQPIDGSKNTYTTLMLETNTSEYDVLIDGNQTNISVSAGKTATVNYSSLVAQLRKDGTVYAPDEKFTVTQQNTTLTAQWKHVDHHYKTPVWRWYRKSAKDNYEASLSTECTVCGLIEKDVNANVTYQDNADGTVTAIAKVVLDSNEWTSEYVFVAGYTVTVENGFINQGAKSFYALGDVVSIYAQPKNSNGENFAGWYVDDGDNNRDNDQLLSKQNLFAVYVRENIKIYARYEAEPEVSPLAFSVQGGIRKRIAGQNKTMCSFTVRWDLSDKVNGNVYRLVDAGVLRSYTVSGENLNLNSVDNNIVRKHSSSKISNLGTFTYTLNMSAATSAKSYNVRGFAVYKNVTSGEKIVVYSDTVHNDPFVF